MTAFFIYVTMIHMGLKEALADIEKRYGPGTITTLGSESRIEIEAISTTCPSLDHALGIGGFPRGRIVEIYGPESSGKTTLALHVISEAQKSGGNCAFIDVEHALDPIYAEKLGVNVDNLLISQPDSAEQALEVVEALIRSEEIRVIVVDSVAALVTQAELNGEMGDAQVGGMARLMSQAMRKLTPIVSRGNVCLIFINQLRAMISTTGYGGPTETTTGGRALKFYASVRLDIRRIGPVKQGENVVGNRTKVKIVKNKLAPPFKTVEFDIIYGEGISVEGDMLDLALEKSVITQKGAWFAYDGKNFGQGRERAREALKNKEFFEEIRTKVVAL